MPPTEPGPRPAPPAILLLGPTASGKTDLAVTLAERLPLDIVSVDSALVYRDMDIGTAKPDAATLARAPHRLVDIVDPTQRYSAGDFRRDALDALAEITARGRIPLLVGGTMLYFKALLHGLDELPPADPGLRAELDARAAREGWPALHAELARLDPVSAARLHPGDGQRIQRALEVQRLTGQPLSALQRGGSGDFPYRALALALLPEDRDWLRQRINLRFRRMLEAGLVDELRRLRENYPLRPDLPSMRCVGYRQAWEYLEGRYGEDELYEKGAAATRQLAKRQLTWLRGWPGLEGYDCRHPDLAAVIAARLTDWLAKPDDPAGARPGAR